MVLFFSPEVSTLLLSDPRAADNLDVGAAAYGPPEDDDGSDALLLASRACDVPCELHGFEMVPQMAAALEKQFARLPRLSAATTFTVHRLGVGAAPARRPDGCTRRLSHAKKYEQRVSCKEV